MTRKSRPAPLSRARQTARALTLVGALASLAGCIEGTPFPTGRSPFSASEPGALTPGKPGTTAQTSLIIADLAGRRSAVAGGGYGAVAQAVLTNSRGSAQSELRVARLTAKAKAKNWLPQIGPSVSLTSLGDLATQLVMEQVFFDNGAKKAERDFAAADVEVAAVTLSQELNDTVHDGLKYYVTALKAHDQGAVAARSAAKIGAYEAIMRERVAGGISDMTEARVLAQKLAEMQATAAADRDAAATAEAQLGAMTGAPVALAGLGAVALPGALPEALAVKEAEGEKARTIAQAKMEQAALLPGLTGVATAGRGKPDLGLSLGTSGLWGFGTKDTIAALKATEEAAGARVERARQEAEQSLTALLARREALVAKEARDGAVVAETADALEMFTEQYRMGGRTLMELVTMYENYANMAHAQTGLKYDIALIELEIAREYGILVDGSSI